MSIYKVKYYIKVAYSEILKHNNIYSFVSAIIGARRLQVILCKFNFIKFIIRILKFTWPHAVEQPLRIDNRRLLLPCLKRIDFLAAVKVTFILIKNHQVICFPFLECLLKPIELNELRENYLVHWCNHHCVCYINLGKWFDRDLLW